MGQINEEKLLGQWHLLKERYSADKSAATRCSRITHYFHTALRTPIQYLFLIFIKKMTRMIKQHCILLR